MESFAHGLLLKGSFNERNMPEWLFVQYGTCSRSDTDYD